MLIARKKLQQNFGRAAASYDARAEFQHTQTRRVLDAALMLFPERAHIADIGCGTGYFAAAAASNRPEWNILGIDIAPGMCAVAATRCTAIAGDAARLPLMDASVDAAVSSLCYQWVEDQAQAFAELVRVLKPGGRAIVASLGASSLQELHECAAHAEVPLHLLAMPKFDASKQALTRAGLEITLAEQQLLSEHYADVAALVESMRKIGAGNNFSHGPRGLLSPKRWQSMVQHYEQLRTPLGIPTTWEHHFFVLHKRP